MKKAEKNVEKALNRRTKSPRILNENTPFAITEAFNQLRTNIMYTPNNEDGCPVYGITSAEIGVGKSTVSANLAISYSKIGKKVLLIDADMRRPSAHGFFGYKKNDIGLSELLAGISDDKSAIRSPMDNLYVVTSGRIPVNPSELLLSRKFVEYINRWKNEYDIIFVDFPPVGIVSDPINVVSSISGFIIIAMAEVSDAVCINNAIKSIENVGGKIIGLVVNATDSKGVGKYRSSKYGYKYSYKYSYTYGYSSDKK